MVVYNVTVSIDPAIHEDWLQWMRETHIPDVMRTGMFLEAQLNRVLSDEDTGVTLYTCESMEKLEQYQSVYSPALQAEHTERYNGKFGAFRTLLEVIEKFEV